MVEEGDGSRWSDFEVGCMDEETFMRLLRRLPKAAKYRSDHCAEYSVLPPVLHKGEGGAMWT